jgi:hypothetical protein
MEFSFIGPVFIGLDAKILRPYKKYFPVHLKLIIIIYILYSLLSKL